MAPSLSKLFLSMLILATSLSAMASTPTQARMLSPKNLAVRLQSNGVMQCWDSLMELRSCTGEVILFFLNGETYLGPSCCRAIRVIEHQCWAADAMLAALGFTAQEGDILRGYCNADGDNSGAPTSSAPPQAAPRPASSGVKRGLNLSL